MRPAGVRGRARPRRGGGLEWHTDVRFRDGGAGRRAGGDGGGPLEGELVRPAPTTSSSSSPRTRITVADAPSAPKAPSAARRHAGRGEPGAGGPRRVALAACSPRRPRRAFLRAERRERIVRVPAHQTLPTARPLRVPALRGRVVRPALPSVGRSANETTGPVPLRGRQRARKVCGTLGRELADRGIVVVPGF